MILAVLLALIILSVPLGVLIAGWVMWRWLMEGEDDHDEG